MKVQRRETKLNRTLPPVQSKNRRPFRAIGLITALRGVSVVGPISGLFVQRTTKGGTSSHKEYAFQASAFCQNLP